MDGNSLDRQRERVISKIQDGSIDVESLEAYLEARSSSGNLTSKPLARPLASSFWLPGNLLRCLGATWGVVGPLILASLAPVTFSLFASTILSVPIVCAFRIDSTVVCAEVTAAICALFWLGWFQNRYRDCPSAGEGLIQWITWQFEDLLSM